MMRLSRWHAAFAVLLVNAVFVAAESQAPPSDKHLAIHYSVSLADLNDHLVAISIDLPPGSSARDLQLPVWNALYQVRDFSQYVDTVEARDTRGRPLAVRKLNKSSWRVSGTDGGAQVKYQIFADLSGPYGAQLNSSHAFFNLAEILMYPVDARSSPTVLHIGDVPRYWKIATALQRTSQGEFEAEDYDRLVDSPVEVGSFQESDFAEGGGH